MISIVKKKNKIKRELLSRIEWACSLNAIKLEHEMILEGCLRIVEHTNLAYVEPHRVIIFIILAIISNFIGEKIFYIIFIFMLSIISTVGINLNIKKEQLKNEN